jgi:hypothetical protein
MLTFKNTDFIFQRDLTLGSKKNIVVWEFEGDPKEIQQLKVGCGCTANCRVEGNTVIAEYEDQSGPKVDPTNIDKLYPTGKLAFNKSINVYLRDGKPLKEFNDKGVKVVNPNKSKIVLTFKGSVDLSPLLTNSSNS